MHVHYVYSECVCKCCTEGLNNKRGTAPPEIAGLYAPHGVDLGGVAPPQEGMTPYGLCRKHCEVQ